MKKLDWENLPFAYRKTNCLFTSEYKDHKWGSVEKKTNESIDLHIAATCLHYGQACFEGFKAYRGKDDKIRLFRFMDNFKRINRTAKKILMPQIPKNVFEETVIGAVKENIEFVPPYESGATLYIRPLLIGTGPMLGVAPSEEYLFMVLVSPVGPYFKGGFQTVNVLLDREHDRAAPNGVGDVKVAGNYAASLESFQKAKKIGCSSVLFLDAKEKKYIDECGHANFFGIKDKTYVTPQSKSILPSITNDSIKMIAQEIGLKVEERSVKVKELNDFYETGACGTAAIINPISKIIDPKEDKEYEYGEEPGEISTKLYEYLRAVQYGDKEDKFDWVTVLKN